MKRINLEEIEYTQQKQIPKYESRCKPQNCNQKTYSLRRLKDLHQSGERSNKPAGQASPSSHTKTQSAHRLSL